MCAHPHQCSCVSCTFMLGGAVRGGEGGHSPRGTVEMFSCSCFLSRRGHNKEGWFIDVRVHHNSPVLSGGCTILPLFSECGLRTMLQNTFIYPQKSFFSLENSFWPDVPTWLSMFAGLIENHLPLHRSECQLAIQLCSLQMLLNWDISFHLYFHYYANDKKW